MNVIFLTLGRITSLKQRGIYTDLMRLFLKQQHDVYIVNPTERKFGKKTIFRDVDGAHILSVNTLNIQKASMIEKGLGIILLEEQYKQAIKKYLRDVRFDLILYTTPPITLANVVYYLKKKNPNATSYLLLKDIFPQNAVDVGLFSEKSLLFKVFRRKEIQLYKASDIIGCLSPANVEFLKKYNPYYPTERIEINPNSIELSDKEKPDRNIICQKYGLPKDKVIFIYGGNLGKPQGIDYVIRCMEDNVDKKDRHFLIVGTGTELPKLLKWYKFKKPLNVTVMEGLPKSEYDQLLQSCDVGLVFLDHHFLIPNYPSRLLSYMEFKMPVICATDVNTDIGRIAEENGYGYWCESKDPKCFTALVDRMMLSDIKQMGEKGYDYLRNNYLVENTYNIIMSHIMH